MTKVNSSLENELKIPAFSKENLLSLIYQNEGILEKELDETADITIQMEANLDWNVAIDNNTRFGVPAYYLPIERFGLNEEANKIFEQALAIQKDASGDIKEHQHHYGHSIFRKLITAIKKLQTLRELPVLVNSNPFDSKELYTTKNFINRLIEDGENKLSKISVQWEYKEWGDSRENFKRYDSKKLSDLIGGKELLEQATEQVLNFDIFEFIEDYYKKRELEEKTIETVSCPKKENDHKPLALSLSSKGGCGVPASYYMAQELLPNYDEEKHNNIISIDSMEHLIWTLDGLKERGTINNIKYVIINSAPPYFANPDLEQFQLMMKYGIYNRGITGFGLDYDSGCVDDILGIMRLIKGEYPELPIPIAICDSSYVLKKYEGVECEPISLSNHESYRKRLQLIKQKLKESTSK